MRKNLIMRLAAAAAGGTLALAVANPAAAESLVIPINQGNVPTTAAEFEGDSGCDDPNDPLGNLATGQDGWHFVLPQGPGAEFVSITLTFETPSGSEPVVIDSTDPDDLSTGGYLDGKHGWLVTEAGWTLISGEAEADIEDPGEMAFFNLSHTCSGDGNGGGDNGGGDNGGGDNGGGDNGGGGEDGDDDQLPVTGLQAGGLLVLGAGLLAAGGAMLFVRRRRSLAGLIEGSDG